MSSMYSSFGGAAARPCMRCGAPLALTESQCSRCGTLNPLPQGQQPGMFQQGQQARSSAPSWGPQSPQSPQFPQNGSGAWPDANGSSSSWGSTAGQAGGWPQNTQFPGQNQPPPQPLQQNLFGNNGNSLPGQGQSFGNNGTGFLGQSQPSQNNPFANYQQNPNNNFFAVSQQKGVSPLGTMNAPARRGYQPNEDEGKRRPGMAVVVVIVVVIVVLLVVVIGGGAFAGYKFLKSNNSTANSIPTVAAISTPPGTPLFSDSFKDNSLNWDATPHAGTKFTIAGGKMVLEADNQSLLFPELLPGKTFADFRIDVDAALAKGDTSNGYGIYIRAASTQDSPLGLYYRFEVYGDGSFWIYKGTADPTNNTTSTALKQSGPNNAVHTDGRLNHLTVIAKGSQLSFIINNTPVSTFTDATYKSGAVALFVSHVAKVTTNAQATFENLAVFPAQ
ncbi:MAG: family 16 glycoside hydrolase [Ktedonobacteraceae bacterium]